MSHVHAATIALIDVSYAFAVRFHSKRPDPVSEVLDFVHDMTRVGNGFAHVILCFDAPPYSRSTLFPDYKGHRAEPSEEEVRMKRELFSQLRRGYSCAFVKGAEADDVIATLCADIQERDDDTRVAIFARDKDLYPLVNSRVTIHEPAVGDRPETLVTPDVVKERTGVAPGQVPDWLALVGDSADNIPGCPGIGAKGATKLLQKFGSLEVVYAKLDGAEGDDIADLIGDTLTDRLRDNRAQVKTALTLVRLQDDLKLDLDALLRRASESPPEPQQDPDDEEEPASRSLDTTGMSLAQRLLAIQREVGPLEKGRKVEGKVRYKYASIGDHLNTAYPLLQDYGLLFETSAHEMRVEGGVMFVHYAVTVYCADNPEDKQRSSIIGGSRLCDVGPGICHSYAVKRWLAELLGMRDGWERDTDEFGGSR